MISYIGGKSQIGTWIRDYIPNDIETYVETFGGMFWVFFRMDDTKYPNLKKVVYNDFNPLNYNLFKNVRGSNYESFGELLLNEDCQGYKDEYDVTTVDDLTNKFKSYQKEIFAPDFKITEENSQDVAKKYAFVLTQVFSGTMPEKGKYMNFKGQYKPKFRTFREKLTTDKYDSFQKKLEKITFCENLDFEKVIDKYDSEKSYFYLDPPYWKTENYYSNHDFDRDDHERLCNQLKQIKGKFGLSYYDFDLLSQWLPKNKFVWEQKEFTKQAVTKKDGTRNKGTELLIMNYTKPKSSNDKIKQIKKISPKVNVKPLKELAKIGDKVNTNSSKFFNL